MFPVVFAEFLKFPYEFPLWKQQFAKSAKVTEADFGIHLWKRNNPPEMAKNSNKNAAKAKKDKAQTKSGTAAIVKAKDKRKKAPLKKVWFGLCVGY